MKLQFKTIKQAQTVVEHEHSILEILKLDNCIFEETHHGEISKTKRTNIGDYELKIYPDNHDGKYITISIDNIDIFTIYYNGHLKPELIVEITNNVWENIR